MRIGTRASALALAQATAVLELLGGDGEIVPIVTTGDRRSAAPASAAADTFGGGEDKSRWVAELELALQLGEIDVAVHSAKDLPGELADGLVLAGTPARAGAQDVLCGASGIGQLTAGARVGTSSIRRARQLRAARADIEVAAMRGNVDTRLAKLRNGGFDAIVLARAGLQRLGREDEIGAVLDPATFVPAPGQGALALQTRAGDRAAGAAVGAIVDQDSFTALLAERSLARALDADCHTPLGGHAELVDGRLRLRAWLGAEDGDAWTSDELEGGAGEPEALGRELAARVAIARTAMHARSEA